VESQLPTPPQTAPPQPAPAQSTPSTPTSPNPLDYGHRPRLHQRPLLRRLALIAILIPAIAFSVHQIRSRLWPALQLYYLQHECLAHPIPSGIQVYSSRDPLLDYKSPQFDALFAKLGPLGFKRAGFRIVPVYLGTREAKDGARRFLAIYALASSPSNIYLIRISRPTGPAPPDKPPQNFIMDQTTPDLLGMYVNPNAQPRSFIYSATEDPNDSSHFTITIDVGPSRHVGDYYLQPDGSITMHTQLLQWDIAPDGFTRLPPGPKPVPGTIHTRTIPPPK
jgi:hypothetical protein